MIGKWVRRRRTKWHLVESEIEGDVVTRCGRRMRATTIDRGRLEVSEVMPLTRMIGQPQLCSHCGGHQ